MKDRDLKLERYADELGEGLGATVLKTGAGCIVFTSEINIVVERGELPKEKLSQRAKEAYNELRHEDLS